MKDFIVHLEFAKILALVCFIVVIFTVVLFLIVKNNRIIKYIPGFILIIVGIYNLFYLGQDSTTVDGINRLYMIIISMISGLIGLSSGLIIGIIKKEK